MQIHLPTHLRSFIEREVASGRYENESQVIEDALERLADTPEPTMTVAEAVAESLAQLERGETRELTDDVFDQLLRQSERDAEQRVPVRDDVRY